MPDELSDTQIALLCDIGQAYRYDPSRDNNSDIEYLLQAGYIEAGSGQAIPTVQLTEKATTFLSARGASLNEA